MDTINRATNFLQVDENDLSARVLYLEKLKNDDYKEWSMANLIAVYQLLELERISKLLALNNFDINKTKNVKG